LEKVAQAHQIGAQGGKRVGGRRTAGVDLRPGQASGRDARAMQRDVPTPLKQALHDPLTAIEPLPHPLQYLRHLGPGGLSVPRPHEGSLARCADLDASVLEPDAQGRDLILDGHRMLLQGSGHSRQFLPKIAFETFDPGDESVHAQPEWKEEQLGQESFRRFDLRLLSPGQWGATRLCHDRSFEQASG